jgi:hypothetical protein
LKVFRIIDIFSFYLILLVNPALSKAATVIGNDDKHTM